MDKAKVQKMLEDFTDQLKEVGFDSTVIIAAKEGDCDNPDCTDPNCSLHSCATLVNGNSINIARAIVALIDATPDLQVPFMVAINESLKRDSEKENGDVLISPFKLN